MKSVQPAGKAVFQGAVDERFTTLSEYWSELYHGQALFDVIHQERHRRSLAWIDALDLPAGARILDLGCGAGIQAVALAQRGFDVDGLDPVAAMVESGRALALQQSVAAKVRFVQGDAHALPYSNATFDVVIALGVLPYLYTPAVALAELARVLKRGGVLLISSHNAHRVNHVLDPRFSPLTRPGKALIHWVTRGRYRHPAPVRAFTHRSLRTLLYSSSFSIERWQSVGFGPFTLFGHALLPDPAGVRLNGWLQILADRGAPVLRGGGNQHLVIARRAGN